MAFATAEDVAARLGRDLTDAETTQVEALLDSATAIIALYVGKNDDWAAELDPVPSVIKLVTIEAVLRAMANPHGHVAVGESLGAYSSNIRYRDGDAGGGLLLTSTEQRLIARAVHGTGTGSVRVDSMIHYCDPDECGS